MTEPRGRPFRMSDAMILIAATAVGFAEARSLYGDLEERPLATWFLSTFALTTTLLPAWSVAFLALRLRRPRPSWNILWRQPGANACLVGVLASVPLQLLYLILKAAGLAGDGPLLPYLIGFMLGGFSIAAIWTALSLDNRLNSEPGWIDRGGTVLGLLWVFCFAIFLGPCFFRR